MLWLPAGCEASRKLATELSTEVLKTKKEKKNKKAYFQCKCSFSLFFFLKVNSLCERCQAESHRQRISFFCKQICIQVLWVKFSVSSLNCPFLFLSAGVVAAVSELKVILWLSSSRSGWWPLCRGREGSTERRRRRVGNGRTCFGKTEGTA